MNYDWLHISKEVEDDGLHKPILSWMNPKGEYKHFWTGNTYYHSDVFDVSTGEKLNVSFSPSTKKLSIGICPSKWVTGQNVRLVGMEDTLEAFKGIENDIGLELGDAKVNQLDITQRPITDMSVGAYTPFLCQFRHSRPFSRLMFNDTLTYSSNSTPVSLTFYDKIRQTKTKGDKKVVRIPDDLKEKNVTTYEVRLNSNKQIREKMGYKEETPRLFHLFQEEYIKRLQEYFKDSYSLIPRNTEVGIDFRGLQGKKAVKDAIHNHTNSLVGRGYIEELLDIADKSGCFPNRQARSEARNDLLKGFESSNKSNVIEELDEKILKSEIKW